MKTYKKGVRAEYELLQFFSANGFSVIRSASSGSFLYPVDVVAIKNGLILAIESKFQKNKPKLRGKRLKYFKDWCKRAGALGFLAWRKSNEWLFLKMDDVENNRYEDENWIKLEKILEIL